MELPEFVGLAATHLRVCVPRAALSEEKAIDSQLIKVLHHGTSAILQKQPERLETGQVRALVRVGEQEGWATLQGNFGTLYFDEEVPTVKTATTEPLDFPEDTQRQIEDEDKAIDLLLGVNHEEGSVSEEEEEEADPGAHGVLYGEEAGWPEADQQAEEPHRLEADPGGAAARGRRMPAWAARLPPHLDPQQRLRPQRRPPRAQPAQPARRLTRGAAVEREIARLQSPSAPATLVPRLAFSRLVRQLLDENGSPDVRITSQAVGLLQEVSEWYVTNHFAAAQVCALHGKRKTVSPQDFTLLKRLRIE